MPFDRSKYPANWEEIRQRILERAKHCCERCGRPNHLVVNVWPDGRWVIYTGYVGHGTRVVETVLTIAHVENPDPLDVRDENLQALCQRCHLRLDGPLHAANAAETRRRRC